jgi:hypothetical protein
MCGDNNTKLLRNIIFYLEENKTYTNFNFSLDIPSQPIKYIEIIAYGIHEKNDVGGVYTLKIDNLLDTPLICHSGNDNSFINFCHGLIFSVDQKQLNTNFNLNINPGIQLGNNQTGCIVFYFVIHY